MPFEEITPRPFTRQGVRTYAPGAPGVYGILNARDWLYIGHTGDIQRTPLDYFQDLASVLMKKQPRGFVFELCGEPRWVSREDRLVLETSPLSTGIHSALTEIRRKEARYGAK